MQSVPAMQQGPRRDYRVSTRLGFASACEPAGPTVCGAVHTYLIDAVGGLSSLSARMFKICGATDSTAEEREAVVDRGEA